MWSLILLIFALSFEYGSPVKTNVRNGPNVRRNTSLPLTFDFIVLGSGTAGSVVANRLSASGQYTVLLLETGTYVEDEPLVSIPYNWGMTVGSSLDRNDLMAVDDPVVKYDLNKRHLASGKALGGTSTINTEMYVRGNPLDYDLWAEQVGTDWNYENVLPYFRRVENSSRYATNPTYHGNQGALHLSPGGYEPIEDMLLVQACLALNMTFVEDWNGAEQITSPSGSVGFHELTIFNGTRQTAFGTYVLPVLNRRNLRHETSYQCVDWYDLETRQAHTTLATKEIIVSMGALRSPQLLLLSGIGNATELNKLGIPVVQDLSGVGENLQDHVITTALWKFIRTKFQSVSDLRADIRIIARTPSGTSLFALAYLIRPHSRGRITLVSRDPTDAPIVQMNYFSDPDSHDVNVLMEGIRRVHEIVSTAPMRNSGFASFANLSDDEQFKNYLFGNEYSTGNSNSGYHFVGTCKMADDSMAVVDARLRVRGIVGLRVIDASIMPFVTSGNTQAPVYRIGEKGAQMILDDNNHT